MGRQTSVPSLRHKYREVYTSVPYDKDDMQRIVVYVNDLMKGDSLLSDCIVHSQDVKSAVGRLKPHKDDGSSCLSTDNFINTGDDCFTHIALLLTSITVHSTAPNSFYVSTIVLSKGRNNNSSDSSKFRGIALSPVYGKIYDNIVFSQHIDTLMSFEIQFGFN